MEAALTLEVPAAEPLGAVNRSGLLMCCMQQPLGQHSQKLLLYLCYMQSYRDAVELRDHDNPQGAPSHDSQDKTVSLSPKGIILQVTRSLAQREGSHLLCVKAYPDPEQFPTHQIAQLAWCCSAENP